MNPSTLSSTSSASREDFSRGSSIKKKGAGLSIPRVFTTPGSDPLEEVTYEKRVSRITNTNGSVVFEMQGAEIPSTWSQVATDIVVSKYFRKAGVPQYDEKGNVIMDR